MRTLMPAAAYSSVRRSANRCLSAMRRSSAACANPRRMLGSGSPGRSSYIPPTPVVCAIRTSSANS